MLVTQLKKILELDAQINNMHRELATLYEERKAMVESDPVAVSSEPLIGRDDWIRQQYDKLKAAWECYDIALPSLKQLHYKLNKAYDITGDLSAAMPSLANKLGVVAVPPNTLLAFPVPFGLRVRQDFIDGQDYVNTDLALPVGCRQWKIVVVYSENAGLPMGLTKDILQSKSYHIGGYDTRALGAVEYAAMTLQYQHPIDDGTWTLLLKGCTATSPVVSATFADGRYRFDSDDAGAGLDIDYFRPAVEAT